MSSRTASIDDPTWVRARYLEAKEIISEVWDLVGVGQIELEPDLLDAVGDFYNATYLDICTTLGPDCGCNGGST